VYGISAGQDAKIYAKADYDHAAAMLGSNVTRLVDNDIRPEWLPDGRLWYMCLSENRAEYKLFDPVNGKKIAASTKRELFEKASATQPDRSRPSRNEVLSPDGKYSAFIRDWNLWIKEVATGQEKALTTDGIENFGYATDNAGWKKSDKPIISWSPDSKKIATFRQDQRHVSDMYLVKTKVGAPELSAWKYPLPGDREIIRIYRIIIDVAKDSGKGIVKLKMGSDARRGTFVMTYPVKVVLMMSAGAMTVKSWCLSLHPATINWRM